MIQHGPTDPRGGATEWIPLFPLGVVLLPGLSLPLHIFEQRYKQMIGECLEADRAFGLVCYTGAVMKEVGCTARVTEVLRRYPDGRLDILCTGQRRFRTEEQDQSKPYLQGRVRYFDDVAEATSEEEADRLRELALRGLLHREELARLLGSAKTAEDPQAVHLKEISFLLAGSEGFTLEEKQAFLEMTSTGQRIRKAVGALEKLVERLKLNLEIRRIIGGNGHPRAVLGTQGQD
jgi:ATP-dependent Lon protease